MARSSSRITTATVTAAAMVALLGRRGTPSGSAAGRGHV
jgi:hypothetical protein